MHLAREAMSRVTDAKRTHTVTRKQISNAIDAFAASLSPVPQSPAEWSERFVVLRERLQTLADMGQTVSQESKDAADAELSAWTAAAKTCVDSHSRDARIAIPWLRFDSADIQSHLARRTRNTAEWAALDPFFQSIPSPEEAADRYEAAISTLTALRESAAKDGSSDPDLASSVDQLLAAIQESFNEAASLVRRLNSVAHTSKSMFDAMDFTFLYDPTRNFSPSAFASQTALSMRIATTCSRPKRASPASSPSPKATCRPRTGSGSVARSRPWAAARRLSRGPARCSST